MHSLSFINWLVSPSIGIWPLVTINGLLVVWGIVYYIKRPKFQILIIALSAIGWSLWFFYINSFGLNLLFLRQEEKMISGLCGLSEESDDPIFCNTAKALNYLRITLPKNSSLVLQVDSGLKPYFYYYLLDSFVIKNKTNEASFVVVQDGLFFGERGQMIKNLDGFSVWHLEL